MPWRKCTSLRSYINIRGLFSVAFTPWIIIHACANGHSIATKQFTVTSYRIVN